MRSRWSCSKIAIRSYVNERNVLNAIDIKEALGKSVGSLRNSKTSVIFVDASGGHMEKAKIQNISRYHYFKREETGYRAWEFQGIAPGKLIPYQPQDFHSSYDILLAIQDELSPKLQTI